MLTTTNILTLPFPVDIVSTICNNLCLHDFLSLFTTCKSYDLDVMIVAEPRTIYEMAVDEGITPIAIGVIDRFPQIFLERDVKADVKTAICSRRPIIAGVLIDKFLHPKNHNLWGLVKCADECDDADTLVKLTMLIYTNDAYKYDGELTLDSIVLNRIWENDFDFCHKIVDILNLDENQVMIFDPSWIMNNVYDEEVFMKLRESRLWEIEPGYIPDRYD